VLLISSLDTLYSVELLYTFPEAALSCLFPVIFRTIIGILAYQLYLWQRLVLSNPGLDILVSVSLFEVKSLKMTATTEINGAPGGLFERCHRPPAKSL